jgi:REP element-mobilizing transposase RayT
MSNHFHLVVETPRGNLVPGMKWLLGTYTSRFNRKHKLFGHLLTCPSHCTPPAAVTPVDYCVAVS